MALGALVLAAVCADIHRHQVEAGRRSDKRPWVEYVSLLAAHIVDGSLDP